MTHIELAKRYSVSQTTIQRMLKEMYGNNLPKSEETILENLDEAFERKGIDIEERKKAAKLNKEKYVRAYEMICRIGFVSDKELKEYFGRDGTDQIKSNFATLGILLYDSKGIKLKKDHKKYKKREKKYKEVNGVSSCNMEWWGEE